MNKWYPGTLAGPSTSASPKQTTMTDFSVKPTPKLASTSKRAQTITRALGEFIAKDMRPVGVVEGEVSSS